MLSSGEGDRWKAALGLAEDVRIIEAYWRRLTTGELVNVDNKRNVALRTDTLLGLMNSLRNVEDANLHKIGYDEKDTSDLILSSFRQAGFVIGCDFGEEAMEPGRIWQEIPELEGRLRDWCTFDEAAGFGKLACQYDRASGQGQVHWENSFLAGPSGTLTDHVAEFALGYVNGVLEQLLGEKIAVCRLGHVFVFEVEKQAPPLDENRSTNALAS
jgi:hypothetical protein